jgi:hypothetical protein
LQKIGQHIYQQAGTSAPSDGTQGSEEKKEGDVVDADYKEVN